MTINESLTGDAVRYLRMVQEIHPLSLAGENLRGADLSMEQLEHTDFSGADLTEVNFKGANLTGANFTGANLTGATFTYADLDQANLTDAILFSTNFTDAHFTGLAVQRGSCQPLLFLLTTAGWQVYNGGWRGSLDTERQVALEMCERNDSPVLGEEGAYRLAVLDIFAAYQKLAHDDAVDVFHERWGMD